MTFANLGKYIGRISYINSIKIEDKTSYINISHKENINKNAI